MSKRSLHKRSQQSLQSVQDGYLDSNYKRPKPEDLPGLVEDIRQSVIFARADDAYHAFQLETGRMPTPEELEQVLMEAAREALAAAEAERAEKPDANGPKTLREAHGYSLDDVLPIFYDKVGRAGEERYEPKPTNPYTGDIIRYLAFQVRGLVKRYMRMRGVNDETMQIGMGGIPKTISRFHFDQALRESREIVVAENPDLSGEKLEQAVLKQFWMQFMSANRHNVAGELRASFRKDTFQGMSEEAAHRRNHIAAASNKFQERHARKPNPQELSEFMMQAAREAFEAEAFQAEHGRKPSPAELKTVLAHRDEEFAQKAQDLLDMEHGGAVVAGKGETGVDHIRSLAASEADRLQAEAAGDEGRLAELVETEYEAKVASLAGLLRAGAVRRWKGRNEGEPSDQQVIQALEAEYLPERTEGEPVLARLLARLEAEHGDIPNHAALVAALSEEVDRTARDAALQLHAEDAQRFQRFVKEAPSRIEASALLDMRAGVVEKQTESRSEKETADRKVALDAKRKELFAEHYGNLAKYRGYDAKTIKQIYFDYDPYARELDAPTGGSGDGEGPTRAEVLAGQSDDPEKSLMGQEVEAGIEYSREYALVTEGGLAQQITLEDQLGRGNKVGRNPHEGGKVRATNNTAADHARMARLGYQYRLVQKLDANQQPMVDEKGEPITEKVPVKMSNYHQERLGRFRPS